MNRRLLGVWFLLTGCLLSAQPVFAAEAELIRDETVSGQRSFCVFVDPGDSGASWLFGARFEDTVNGSIVLNGKTIYTWKKTDSFNHTGPQMRRATYEIILRAESSVRVKRFTVYSSRHRADAIIEIREVECEN